MFNFGIVHVFKDSVSWMISFSCPCKQCEFIINKESFTWRHPWKIAKIK